jgi:single-strand DNA-binding protein
LEGRTHEPHLAHRAPDRDPELRATPSGVEVAQLRLAVPRRRRSGDDRGAVYVDVTAFEGETTACGQYLAKGRRVAVSGRLEYSEWTTRDGQARSRHEVIADEIEFLDTAERLAEAPEPVPAEAPSQPSAPGGVPTAAARRGLDPSEHRRGPRIALRSMGR